MNPSARNYWCRGVLLVLCALLLAEFFTGMFPFSPVEGDEQAVINGLREMIRPGGADLRWRYSYPLQPGSYWITIGIHDLTHVDVGLCYFALSAVCAALFALMSAAFIGAVCGVDFAPALVLALLCQEIQRAGCYANSSTVGGSLVLAGLLVGSRRRDARLGAVAIAGALIGLGAWCRLDALVLTPAFFFLRWNQKTLRRAVIETLQAALVAIVTLVALYAAIHVGWRDILEIYSGRDTDAGYGRTLAGFYQISSLGILLAAGWGGWICCRRREFLPLALLLAVLGPSLFLYSKSLMTPKYFYYLTPFLAILAAAGATDLFKNRRRWLGGDDPGGGGGRVVDRGAHHPDRVPPLYPPANDRNDCTGQSGIETNGLGCWVGRGARARRRIVFADGPGVRGHRLARGKKTRALDELAALQRTLDVNPQLAMLTSTYASYQCTVGLLRVAGFECVSQQTHPRDAASHLDRWIKGDRVCWLAWVNEGPVASAVFADYAGRYRDLPRYFFNDLGPAFARHLAESPVRMESVTGRVDGFFALYLLPPGGR